MELFVKIRKYLEFSNFIHFEGAKRALVQTDTDTSSRQSPREPPAKKGLHRKSLQYTLFQLHKFYMAYFINI